MGPLFLRNFQTARQSIRRNAGPCEHEALCGCVGRTPVKPALATGTGWICLAVVSRGGAVAGDTALEKKASHVYLAEV